MLWKCIICAVISDRLAAVPANTLSYLLEMQTFTDAGMKISCRKQAVSFGVVSQASLLWSFKQLGSNIYIYICMYIALHLCSIFVLVNLLYSILLSIWFFLSFFFFKGFTKKLEAALLLDVWWWLCCSWISSTQWVIVVSVPCLTLAEDLWSQALMPSASGPPPPRHSSERGIPQSAACHSWHRKAWAQHI